MADLYMVYGLNAYFADRKKFVDEDTLDYEPICFYQEDDDSLDEIEYALMAQITDAEKALAAVRGEQRARSHKPCPHCGKRVMRSMNYGEVYGQEPGPTMNRNIAVVCDASNGGCGANGGFAMTEDSAWEKWDRRAE